MLKPSMKLVENGACTFPLYHGTSSLFVDSIRKLGLGARNPLAEYGVVHFLESISRICEELFADDDEWIARRVCVQPMVNQEITAGGFNFQHGDSYLTPSRSSAVGYALSNPFGSEIISQAFFLYSKIEKRRSGEIHRRGLSDSPLLKLFKLKPEPCLVVAENVPVQSLIGERGNPVDEVLRELQEFWDFLHMSGVSMNINFRLVSPVPPGLVSIERLNPEVEVNPYRD